MLYPQLGTVSSEETEQGTLYTFTPYELNVSAYKDCPAAMIIRGVNTFTVQDLSPEVLAKYAGILYVTNFEKDTTNKKKRKVKELILDTILSYPKVCGWELANCVSKS